MGLCPGVRVSLMMLVLNVLLNVLLILLLTTPAAGRKVFRIFPLTACEKFAFVVLIR